MIAIVGAGLAGLSCARALVAAGHEVRLYEADGVIGGRVRSDRVGGFVLDRGFQVLLDSYGGVRPFLRDLRPCYFDSGALLWDRGNFWVLKNPLRHAGHLPAAVFSGGLPFADKLALAGLVVRALGRGDRAWLATAAGEGPDEAMIELVRRSGVSPVGVERFLRPFFGGVFLDDSLSASGALFSYYLRKFTLGRAFVPAGGAGALPARLAVDLPAGVLCSGREVVGWEIGGDRVTALRFRDGGREAVDQVVLAMGPGQLARFLGHEPPPTTTVATLSFAGATSLYPDRLIVLPAGRRRIVRHFVQISNIAPEYAPSGRHLVVATALHVEGQSTADLVRLARAEMEEVFPAAGGLDLLDLRLTREATLVPRPGRLGRELCVPVPPNALLIGDTAGWSCVESALLGGQRGAERLSTGIGCCAPAADAADPSGTT